MLSGGPSRSGVSAPRLFLIAASMVFVVVTEGGLRAQLSSDGAQAGDERHAREGGEAQGAGAARGGPAVSRSVAGLKVFVDRATGRLRPPTPAEARRLAEGLREMLSQSEEGLEIVRHPNGMLSVDLQGRFQNAAVATMEADGGVVLHCAHDAGSAATLLSGAGGAGAASGDVSSRRGGGPAPKRPSRSAEEE